MFNFSQHAFVAEKSNPVKNTSSIKYSSTTGIAHNSYL